MRADMINRSIAVWDDGEYPTGHGGARTLLSAVGSVLSALSSQDRCDFPWQGMKFAPEAVSHGDLSFWRCGGQNGVRIWICCQIDGCGIGGMIHVLVLDGMTMAYGGVLGRIGVYWGCIGCVMGVIHALVMTVWDDGSSIDPMKWCCLNGGGLVSGVWSECLCVEGGQAGMVLVPGRLREAR